MGDYGAAVVSFREAVEVEGGLNYNEPPDWFFSVRHLLGNALIQDGKYAEAELVFLQDLKYLKNNGWALKGLEKSLEKQDKNEQAASARRAFEEAWSNADVTLESSVLDD